MKIGVLTNEYPPFIYGGAGVHVEYLVRELAGLEKGRHELKVFYFGKEDQCRGNIIVQCHDPAFSVPADDPGVGKFLNVLLKDLVMTGAVKDVDLIHCHTWYTHLAGCLLKQLLDIPLVLTTHSLEPQRPWKAEQLGPAYRGSTWVENMAYQQADGVIAVSRDMKRAVHRLYGVPLRKIRVIYNGIDLNQYQPRIDPAVLDCYGIDSRIPYVLFVGRITRQKGLSYLLDAVPYLLPGVQTVVCAASPDTEEIAREIEKKIRELQRENKKVIWISEMVPREKLIALYTQAFAFICPSIYEPFGIINLEAMACETPVIGSAVGGISEIVLDKETGLLVPFDQVGEDDPQPKNPGRFARDLAVAANDLLSHPEKRRIMGKKSRKRVETCFSWTAIARQTLDCYRQLRNWKQAL
jgi:alpha-maltose-1-phosphate synthase